MRKPAPLRTANLFAKCHVDRGRVVVEISDRAPWQDLGTTIPNDEELKKLGCWIKRVRAFRRGRKKDLQGEHQ